MRSTHWNESLEKEVTAAVIEAAADFVHDMDAGGPGSGRHPGCEVCGVTTKGSLCPKCNEAVQTYRNRHGANHADAIDDLKDKYKRQGEQALRKYSSTFNGDLEQTLKHSLNNVKSAWDGVIKPTYPSDHKAAMKVPKGGSSCASCEYLEGKGKCNNKYFIKWNGSKDLPLPADEYCSDWYEPKDKNVKAAEEVSLAGDQKGSLWNGIKVSGFTGPEEEALRAMLSRVPPELLFNVVEIQSAKELNAKHGRFDPDTKVISFNPHNWLLRQRYGKGPGWMLHAETTIVHEVGHSIYEALTPEKKTEWLKLGNWMKGWKQGQAPAYEETRPGWPHDISKWTHLAGLKLPRHYSSRNANEAFSDCFSFFILGKAHMMEPSIKQFMENLVKDNVKRYPSVSIESPLKPYVTTGN